jgi:hypothetical protein
MRVRFTSCTRCMEYPERHHRTLNTPPASHITADHPSDEQRFNNASQGRLGKTMIRQLLDYPMHRPVCTCMADSMALNKSLFGLLVHHTMIGPAYKGTSCHLFFVRQTAPRK